MTRTPTTGICAPRPGRRAFTLIELAVSVLITSVLLVAALSTVGAAGTTEYKTAERHRALLLAQDLMAEILQQAYADPEFGLGSFGLGGDEVGDGSRALWEDVDDYDGWAASPPETKDGSPIPWATDYERSVSVNWVEPANLLQPRGTESGIKRIEVLVKHQDREIVTLWAYRTQVWSDPAEVQGGGS